MVKTLIFFILIPFLQITAGSNNSPAQDIYYNIIQKDTFYFLLSNNNIKLLSNSNSSKFILWDSIPGQFSESSLIAVNNNYLLLKNNDSIYLYNKDLLNGKLIFKNKSKDTLNHTLFFPFNNDFIAVSNSLMNILGCNDDSSFIKTFGFASYTEQSIDYPYFVSGKNIYKYIDGFGYYLAYSINEPLIFSTTYKSYIIYRTERYIYPGGPPSELSLKGRILQEPDFPVNSNRTFWGVNEIFTYGGQITLSATDNYLRFKYPDCLRCGYIYTYSADLILNELNYTDKIIISDKYIFKLGSDIEVSTSTTSPAVFSPLIYGTLTGLKESLENNPVFALNQNYPNPFNPETKIEFTLSDKGSVKLVIYNILGKVVKNLISQEMEKGIHIINFKSEGLSSGIYFYSLITGKNTITKKMIILK